MELLGTNNLSSAAAESYRSTSNNDLSWLIFKKPLTFVLYMDAAFMSYLSEMYNCLKQLKIFTIASLANEDEYIRSAKKYYSYDAGTTEVNIKTENEEELFYD